MSELVITYNLPPSALGHLTSAVQLGFILGTLIFAVLSIADRFSPSRVFFVSAILGAVFNLAIIWEAHSLSTLLLCRVMTGFFLAGIYPVGMKIAADYYKTGLGKSLGFLVGALVLGTAFPHLLKELTDALLWKTVLIVTSSLALLGGVLIMLLVPDGPYRQTQRNLKFSAFFQVFRNRNFRAAAFGYFGHMWELYAFWAFVPVLLQTYNLTHPEVTFNVSLWSFLIIGIGGLSCVLGGYISQRKGTKTTASVALLLSCTCCLAVPWMFALESDVFIGFLLLWGMLVIADSPLLSTLVAQSAPAEVKGTALTIVNCIGFAITIVSIQLLSSLMLWASSNFIYTLLAIGPLLGLTALRKKVK
ncbi:Predicted arabinose efflux permease, MFS family [Psychroflexus sediminis]|uniref:Predicted arabinose efflux permease, MFS family n=2 Tax=Psychroflexus sediminis TaxID=470826 RepID=A0A1G7Z748_9FLAO|nr:Predicted arabinose efflux permease, MFS family [Psychroflexus sediminis]